MIITEAWDAICDVPVPDGYELSVNAIRTVTKSGYAPDRMQVELCDLAKQSSLTVGVQLDATAEHVRWTAADLIARHVPAPSPPPEAE